MVKITLYSEVENNKKSKYYDKLKKDYDRNVEFVFLGDYKKYECFEIIPCPIDNIPNILLVNDKEIRRAAEQEANEINKLYLN